PVTVAVAGTVAGRIDETGAAVMPGAALTLAAGTTLRLDGPATGARGYLAIPGVINVPVVLVSRSTALGAGFGGLDGRALRAGDRLRAGDKPRAGDTLRACDSLRAGAEAALLAPPATWPGSAAPEPGPIRLLPGPHADELGPAALDALTSSAWTVSPASDRVG